MVKERAASTSAWRGIEGYLRWKKREERQDVLSAKHYADHVLQNDDPECEAAISALEIGWSTKPTLNGNGRSS